MQGLKFLYLHIRESTSLVHVVNNVDQMRQGRQYPICNMHLRSLELLFSISFSTSLNIDMAILTEWAKSSSVTVLESEKKSINRGIRDNII